MFDTILKTTPNPSASAGFSRSRAREPLPEVIVLAALFTTILLSFRRSNIGS